MDQALIANKKFIMKKQKKRLWLVFFLLASFFFTIFFVENLLVSFLLALVVNYLLTPLVKALERQGLSQKMANIIPFTVIFCLVGALGVFLSPFITGQLEKLHGDLPKYIKGTTELIEWVNSWLQNLIGGVVYFDFGQRAEELLVSWSTAVFTNLPEILSRSLTVLFLFPFLSFFMLLDGRQLSRNLIALVPNNWFELALSLKHEINLQIGEVIRARLLESLIVGVIVWVGLILVGFPYSHLLAIFAAAANLIPYIGPFIGGIPALIIAWINGYVGLEFFFVLGIYAFAQLVDILIIIPVLVAKIANLHPIVIILSIIIGSQLMGILGMIISIPIASTIKITLVTFYRHIKDFR